MKEFKVPTNKKQPVFKLVKKILKPFYRVNEIIQEEPLPEKCIVVSNHSAKNGPFALDIYFPQKTAKWGAYWMLGNYSSRFHYLRDVFYIKKQGMKKGNATLKSGFEAIFSPCFYKGMRILPSYPDTRFRKTLDYSLKALDNGLSVMVFPENSNEGYKEVLTEFFSGFVILAEQYYKKMGEDIPIVPTYYHKKKKKIAIGKSEFVQKLKKLGMNRLQIAEHFKDRVNELFFKHIKGKDEENKQ